MPEDFSHDAIPPIERLDFPIDPSVADTHFDQLVYQLIAHGDRKSKDKLYIIDGQFAGRDSRLYKLFFELRAAMRKLDPEDYPEGLVHIGHLLGYSIFTDLAKPRRLPKVTDAVRDEFVKSLYTDHIVVGPQGPRDVAMLNATNLTRLRENVLNREPQFIDCFNKLNTHISPAKITAIQAGLANMYSIYRRTFNPSTT